MKKGTTPTMEELFKHDNIFPVEKVAYPMVIGFKDGEPIYADKPFICYDIVKKEKDSIRNE